MYQQLNSKEIITTTLAVFSIVFSAAFIYSEAEKQAVQQHRGNLLASVGVAGETWDRVLQNQTFNGDVVVPDNQKWLIGANVVINNGNLRTVNGTIAMRAGSSLKLSGGNPENYVGGGMHFEPLFAQDYGIWIGGHEATGRLDISCTPKTSWNRTGSDPTWSPGDEYWISPTAPGDFAPRRWYPGQAIPRFDSRVPAAEVMNVTRDCVIEGPGHIHIHSSVPQRIEYVRFERMGIVNKTRIATTGRYALHFHFAGNGSRGTVVRGVASTNAQGRVFVPHESNGISFIDNVAVNNYVEAFWWDEKEPSNEIFVDRLAVSGVFVPRSVTGQESRFAGIALNIGDNTEIKNSAVSGVRGSSTYSAGFDWVQSNKAGNAHWIFKDGNAAHNNSVGIRFWNNSGQPHDVLTTVLYNNGKVILNGAYNNSNRYEDIVSIGGGGIALNSSSNAHNIDGGPGRFERVQIYATQGPALESHGRNLPAKTRQEFIDCVLQSGTGSPKVLVKEGSTPWAALFRRCNLIPDDIVFQNLADTRLENTSIFIENADGNSWEVFVKNGQKEVRKVSNEPIATIGVVPNTATMYLQSTRDFFNLNAVLKDAMGNELYGRAITWTSSDTRVATVSSLGVVWATRVGSVVITATSEGKSANANIKVSDSQVIDTTPPTAPSNLQASATSPTQINLTWNASTDNVAVTGYRVERCAGSTCSNFVQIATPTTTTHSDTGLSASAVYRYRVRATDLAGNLSSYSSIVSVTTQAPPLAPVATVTITPTTPTSLEINKTLELTATLRDASNNILTGRAVTWASSNTSRATISSSGLVTGKASGAVTLTATSEGKSATRSLTITAPSPTPPTLLPPNAKKFNILTNLTGKDLKSVPDFELGILSKGKIKFNQAVSLGREKTPLDLDSTVFIEESRVTVNSSSAPELNKPATITLYNITLTEPKIMKDGVVCTTCTLVSYDRNTKTLVFTVPGFSTYEVVEGYVPPQTPNPPTSSPGGGGGSSRASGTATQTTSPNRIQTTSNLNVRTSPSPNASIVSLATRGTRGTIISTSPVSSGGTSWVQVRYDNGITGWSAQNFLQAEAVTTLPTNMTEAQRQELIRSIQVQIAALIQQLIIALQAEQRVR
jgi:hypothetical protein